ncbi:MAG: HEAT repeat domain-containing protein [Myxococcota bacterium]
MIEQEIRSIIEDRADDGDRLNGIVDGFREGRKTTELLPLLDARDSELVSIATWILSEIPTKLYCGDEAILSRLKMLVFHEEPSVRFGALNALLPTMSASDSEARDLLKRLLHDPNEGVRLAARAAADGWSLDS